VKPLLAVAATEVSDDELVAGVREGSEEAFEALYRRYRPRIVAYVRGMCADHARAEDVAQEAFMSALRGLRSSDNEIAFRPWLYEIAKNACIDHMRRAGRSAEVSIDSEDFSPQEEGRISQSVSGTDAQVARRKELESLQMAFGDLPASQHQILVMRELEGLSYDRIGSRMGLSRPAVESLLFRARRTLRDGFDEIDTGERCHRMRIAMEAAADGGRVGLRERRRLTTHLRQCAGCRRTAVTIGLDELALAAARERGSALHRVAGLLPLPAFLRRRLGDAAGALNSIGPAGEQGTSLAAKATAVVVAAALAAGGAGVAHQASGGALPLPGGLGGSDHSAAGSPGGDGSAGAGAGGGSGSSAGAAGAGGAAEAPAGSPGGQTGHGGTSGPVGASGEAVGGHVQGLAGSGQRTTGPLAGTVGGAVGGTTGTVGSLTGDVGRTVERTGDNVTGKVDQTLQDATGGEAPRLPKLSVPDTSVSVPGAGGGSSSPSLPDAGGSLGGSLPKPPVGTPGASLPNTGLTVPNTGLRLP
jgi:RNA polymerase sigma factor (sigma-70 family)